MTLQPMFHGNGFLPLWAIRKIKNVILYYRSLGYECTDLSPQNLVFDSKMVLKLLILSFFKKSLSPRER